MECRICDVELASDRLERTTWIIGHLKRIIGTRVTSPCQFLQKNLLFVIVTSLGDVTHEQMKTGEIGRNVVQVKQMLTYRLRIHRFKFL